MGPTGSWRRLRQARGWRAVQRLWSPIVVSATLLATLPMMAIAERVRPGSGRRAAVCAIRLVSRICGVTFTVRASGTFDDDARYVFVPNHSSPLDIAAMLVARPDVRFLAAAELFRNRLLAMAMRALGTIAIDRGDPAAARRQLEDIARRPPSALVVFAEGGIVPRGERVRFKTGAFALAIGTGATVVPVAISGTDHVLPPGSLLAVQPGAITIDLLEPIATTTLGIDDRKAIRDRTQAAVLDALGSAP